jgi:hypothetical protein
MGGEESKGGGCDSTSSGWKAHFGVAVSPRAWTEVDDTQRIIKNEKRLQEVRIQAFGREKRLSQLL